MGARLRSTKILITYSSPLGIPFLICFPFLFFVILNLHEADYAGGVFVTNYLHRFNEYLSRDIINVSYLIY